MSSLRTNVLALTILQATNYIIPIILLPFLTRTLGVASYGAMIFAQTVISYFTLLVDYGFSLSATRKVAANQQNVKYIQHVFIATWIGQWILLLLSGLILFVLCATITRFHESSFLYYAAFITVVGTVVSPVWYLQAIEHMRVITIAQVIGKFCSILLLFFLVKTSSDTALALLILGFGNILSGVTILLWLKHTKLISFYWPGTQSIKAELTEGFSLFVSRIATSFYTTFVPLLLGFLAGPVALANFQVADRVRIAAQTLITPISQALYPRMNFLFSNERNAATMLAIKALYAIIAITFFAGLIIFIAAPFIINILADHSYVSAVSVLRWLALLPLIIGVSNVLGVQVMLPTGMITEFNTILIIAGVIGAIFTWPFIIIWKENGAAFSLLITEIFVTTAMGIAVFRTGHLKLRK